MSDTDSTLNERRRMIYVQQRIAIVQDELTALRAEREELKTKLSAQKES
ncbi:hypothetical protein [Celeribacter arenosi]|uniref:Transposase n=1 Tax=Celeribacter arenosi TaxID=792649 RepID=A0ABP7JYL2_9RHOB